MCMYGVEGCQNGNTADYPPSSLQTYNIATDRATPSTKQVYEKKERKEGGEGMRGKARREMCGLLLQWLYMQTLLFQD